MKNNEDQDKEKIIDDDSLKGLSDTEVEESKQIPFNDYTIQLSDKLQQKKQPISDENSENTCDVDEGFEEGSSSANLLYITEDSKLSNMEHKKTNKIEETKDQIEAKEEIIVETREEIIETTNESQQKEENDELIPYLIWVDPERNIFYRMDLDTYKIAYEHINDEKLAKKYKNKISKNLKAIKRVGKFINSRTYLNILNKIFDK